MCHWKTSNVPLSTWYEWNSEDSNSDIDSLNGTSLSKRYSQQDKNRTTKFLSKTFFITLTLWQPWWFLQENSRCHRRLSLSNYYKILQGTVDIFSFEYFKSVTSSIYISTIKLTVWPGYGGTHICWGLWSRSRFGFGLGKGASGPVGWATTIDLNCHSRTVRECCCCSITFSRKCSTAPLEKT